MIGGDAADVVEVDGDVGIEEVGEQMMHDPPSNWDGMHGPSRRALLERELDGDDEGGDDEDDDGIIDPYVDSDVVGRLIENNDDDVNNGLYDWEDDDERMMDKSYSPPIDSVTVRLLLSRRENTRVAPLDNYNHV